jgi:hypothetical protein
MADALAILARLRRLQVTQAQRAMADALAAERGAALAKAAAGAALCREALATPGDAAHPLARGYAAWLPAGQADMRAAHAAGRVAEAGVDKARTALAELRAAESAVAHVCQERASAGHARILKKQQAELESAAVSASKKA